MNLSERCAGVLLHPTSLPGIYGIGELGEEAYRFVRWLAKAGQRIWQILPLGPTGYADSPYAAFSAFAGNPMLVSVQRLFDEGLLTGEDFADYPALPAHRVDYGRLIPAKMALLRRAFERWRSQATDSQRAQFQKFCEEQARWLEDFALFMALKARHQDRAWIEWEEGFALRRPNALQYARQHLAEEIDFHRFVQYLFFQQWFALKRYANQQGVRILGDMPIFVALDSADVWAQPDLFWLDRRGEPLYVAGVPPDYFSPTGQRWGNPLYRWSVMRAQGYRWWVDRFRWTLQLVDIVRVDHFRGFAAYWRVPASEPTAVNGKWVRAPGKRLFQILLSELGPLPVVAEDLGFITPDVVRLRVGLGFPGMRVLQFAFDGNPDNPYLPYNYDPNTVVYTGTHDNNTVVGWFHSLEEGLRALVSEYIGHVGEGIHWGMIRLAYSSVARVAIVPLQDWLGLGSEARMNVPGTTEGNWQWRCTWEPLTEELAHAMRKLCALYGRRKG